MTPIDPAAAANKQLNLVLVGGSQGTGKAAVQQALSRSRVGADVVAPLSLKGAFDGADGVVITLGATLGALRKDPTLMSRGR